mmetsp:Transcript_59907/g.175085  ORF Transcript_59907/g.175085 Transcript_59907/m.175085 type:complete len:533 (+) Transcript_59907:293-1891(+)
MATEEWLHKIQLRSHTAPPRQAMPGCDMPGAVEVIADRLFWASLDDVPEDTRRCHYFSIDEDLVYQPFCSDFGPLNLGMVYQYCKHLAAKLDQLDLKGRHIVHVCSTDCHKRANSAFLMCAYQVIALQRSAQAAFKPFSSVQPPFLGFRDALPRACSFRTTIADCLEGLEKAGELGWFDWGSFDLDAYEFLDRVENCDANWIVPDKFLAFAGPSSSSQDSDGFPNVTPEDCLPIFQKANVGLVVRLNRKDYDRKRFVDTGVRHVDLYFADGSCPPEEIVSRFLCIAENEPGAIAVHCKAGLGRTCTLIGLYVMKHYHFPARAFIGWARICRPGSVLGPQQQFLVDMQDAMFAAGAEQYSTPPNPASLLSPSRAGAGQQEDVGQGEWLCGAKRGGRSPLAETTPQPIPFNLPPAMTQSKVPLLPLAKASPSQPVRAFAAPMPTQVSSSPSSRKHIVTMSVKVSSLPPQQLQHKVLLRHSASALPAQPRPAIARQASVAGLGCHTTSTNVAVSAHPSWETRPTLVARTAPVSAF